MIESIDDFKKNLKEVDILIAYSRANVKKVDKYKLFNKTAVVLLCSHFEVFIEAFISEHVDVLKSCYLSDTLPQYMKDNYINDTIKLLRTISDPSKNPKPLKALFRLHDSATSDIRAIPDLELDIKYSFGRHGQKDTERLFRKFGFATFVLSQAFQDPFKVINSVINIRNHIVHEGSAPMLTHEDIVSYRSEFLKFANGLEQYVIDNQSVIYGRIYYV